MSGRMSTRVLRVGLPAAATFLAGATVLSAIAPWPSEYGLASKLDYYTAHQGEYDGVFLGSSRVFRGVVPQVIDEELAQRGVTAKTFNLGVAGMVTYEMDYVLHRVLALDSERPRWIAYEGGAWDPRFHYEANRYSARSVYWHTPSQTAKALWATSHLPDPFVDRLDLAWTHVQHMLWKFTCYGAWKSFADHLRGENTDTSGRSLTEAELAEDRGYQSLEKLAGRDDVEQRERLLRDLSGYLGEIERRKKSGDPPAELAWTPVWAIEAQHEAARAANVDLLYTVLPSVEPTPEAAALAERGAVPALYDFNRPAQYPELFDPSRHYDAVHMNELGASELSRLLAAAMAERLRTNARR